MKPKFALRHFLLLASSSLLAISSASATTLYWDANGTGTAGAGATPNGTWGVDAYWSTDSTGANIGSPVLTATTTAFDNLFFSAGTDAVNPYAISLNSATQNARLVTFEDGTATLSTGTLSLGNGGGITVTTGTVTGATISSGLTISGRQTFNVAASRTLTLDTGTFTRNAGATLNILSTGTVTSTMTGLNSGTLVNGIIGPWASYGSGTSTRYATFSGSNIAAYSGGTAAANAAAVTSATGTVNYDVAAVGTLGTGANINTLRYTGAGGTIAGALTTNGIMNVSSNTGNLLFSGAMTSGSGEMVIHAANGSIQFSGGLNNNGNLVTITGAGAVNFSTGTISGAGGITMNGSGLLSLNGVTNSYLGTTTMNAGTTQFYGNYPSGNLTLNGGALKFYFGSGTTRALGSGAGQIQIIGGDSGFDGNNGACTVNFGGAGAEVQWGSTFFNPTSLRFQDTASVANDRITFVNALDLNGATRTIAANGSSITGATTFSGLIRTTSGTAGLIKTGAGILELTNAGNSYNGGTTISAGTLIFGSIGAMPASGAVAVSSGTTLGIDLGTAGDWTTGTSGVGTLGGLLAGLGGAGSSTVTYAGNVGLRLNVGANSDYGAVIANPTGSTSLALTKAGASNLTLSSSNTFTGGLIIGGGGVILGNAGALNSTVGSENAVSFITGATGKLTLNGNSVIVQSLNGASGTHTVENVNATPASLTIGNSANAASTFSGIIQDGTGGGALTLIKAGGGTLTLSGTSTFTGGMILNAGTLTGTTVQNFTGGLTVNGGSLGTGTFLQNIAVNFMGNASIGNGGTTTINSAAIDSAATLTLNAVTSGNSGTTLIFTNGLSGSGDLRFAGGTSNAPQPKTLTLNNSSGFTGDLLMDYTANNVTSDLNFSALGDGGKILVGGPMRNPLNVTYSGSGNTFNTRQLEFGSGFANTGMNINSNGSGALVFNTALSVTSALNGKTLTLGGTTTGINNAFNGAIANGGGTAVISVAKSGVSTWILSNTANSYTGGTTITGGILQFTRPTAMSATGTVAVGAAGTLAVNAGAASGEFTNATSGNGSIGGLIAGVGGQGAAVTFASGAKLGIDTTNAVGGTMTYAGVIGGVLGIAKLGAGILVLDQTNTYTGTTSVNGGTLEIQNAGTGITQSLGALAFAGADGTLLSNNAGTGTLSTTYTSFTARTAGYTGNVVSTGGTPGTTNVINLTGAAGFIDKGVFFNGADFAARNATNTYIRALNYGVDPSTVASDTVTAANHVKITADRSGAAIALLSLNLSGGGVDWTTTSGAFSVPGIIKSGGGAASVISGGTLTTASNAELVIRTDTANDSLSVTSQVTGFSGGLTKSGAGTLTLSNASNNYTGATNINAGTLAVSGTGVINSTSAINVAAGGTFRYNSSTALTKAPTLAGNGLSNRAVLGGIGSIGVAVTLDNVGDVLSPGNSPGIESFTVGQSWASFSYDWEINDFSAVTGLDAGSDFDQIGITGGLTLTGAAANSYYLNVLSLTAGNVTGLAQNFTEVDRSWIILTTTTGITDFNASYWNVDATGFTNGDTGTWSIAQDGNNLVLNYAAVPEPGAALIGGLGMLILLRRRRN